MAGMKSPRADLLPPRRVQRLGALLLLALVALWTVVSSRAQRQALAPGPDFASFEAVSEVLQWKATGRAAVQQSSDFPSWQSNSLRLEVPAGAAGGVETNYVPRLWHRFEALQFFVYAQQPGELRVELSDGARASPQAANLKKGSNHVQLRLNSFAHVDLREINRLSLSVTAPAQDAVLFLDRFRLTEFNDVLAEIGRMEAPYSTEVATPHFRWANPYSRGPIRTLVVSDVAHGRGTIELAQRLECKLFPVSLGSSSGLNRWGFGDFYGQRGDSYRAPFTLAYTYLADDLLNGPEYDVMVLPGIRPWDELPAAVRTAIRERVKAGMGLVLLDVGVADAAGASDLLELSPLRPLQRSERAERWNATGVHYVTRNVPLEAFPYQQMRHSRCQASGSILVRTNTGDPVVAVKNVGKGRVLAAAYAQRGLIPLVENQWRACQGGHYWEYMYSLLARALVWAAGKEPEEAVEGLSFPSPADPKQLRVTLSGRPGPDRIVEVKVRDQHWKLEAQASSSAGAAGSALDFNLPAVPRGPLHFVDVVLRSKTDGKIVDWGTSTYSTALPAEIAEIRLASDRFPLGAAVTGEFDIRGAASPGLTLRASLFDNYGRLLSRRDEILQPGLTRVPFSLPSEGVLTRLAWVEGQVIENGIERHGRRRDVFILQPRRWDDYDVVMYLFGTDPAPGLWETIQQRLKEMHVTTLSSYPLELSKHANFGVQAQTRISGQESPDGKAREPYLEQKRNYARTKDKKYLARLFCLNSPAYLERQEGEIARLVPPWVPFSPMSYYIYEEPSLTCYEDAMDLCFSEFCLSRMRAWLKGEYATLEGLNREWGTQFSRWDEVVPDTTEEAQQRGNYASWADHRSFMEKTYADNYAYVRQLLHRHDPQGLVLLSGTQESSPHNGCDYYQLNQILGHLNPYTGGNQLEFHRSFNPRLRMSAGSGYGVHGRRALYNLYSGLFHGFWAGAYIFWQYSILNPDWQFSHSAQDIQKALAEIKDGGIARVISSAARDNDGIAIHYSYPSIHATWIPDGRTTGPDQNPSVNAGPTGRKFRSNRDGWVNILKDLGLQFDFIARQQIEAGELIKRNFRALILPFSVAITEKEIGEISKFVKAGGVLIADGQAGVMDGHAKWLARGSLEELFGVSRSSPAREQQIASSEPEAQVRASEGKALATLQGIPVLIVNRHGKGTAIYLNFFLSSYVEDRRDRKEGRWKELLSRALSQVGIKGSFQVLGGGGQPLDSFLLVSYRAGSARYLGILKNDDSQVSSQPLGVELDQPYQVYEVRKKAYLGRTARISDSIRTAEPKLYALLPAPVRGIRIASNAAARRGAKLSYRITVDADRGFNPVLLVRVFNPAGSLVREYSENLEAKAGVASSGFHLAMNEPQGTWKVLATEAVSGRQATLRFKLP